MMKKEKKREDSLLKKTFLTALSVLITASVMNAVYAEEEGSAEKTAAAGTIATATVSKVEIEAVREKPVAKEEKVAPKKATPIGIGLTPLFGMMKSIDNNSLLVNKYTAGIAAEVGLTSNLAVEGVFRYAEFNVRPDLVIGTPANPYVSASHGYTRSPVGSYQLLGVVGSMRQTMVGGNLKYESHPDSVISPFIGGGISRFSNEYTTSPKTSYIKVTFPQSVVGANVLGGLKLNLAKNFSLLGRGEVGQLLNNKNPEIYSSGGTAKVQSYRNFRSYDKYWTALVGMTVGF